MNNIPSQSIIYQTEGDQTKLEVNFSVKLGVTKTQRLRISE